MDDDDDEVDASDVAVLEEAEEDGVALKSAENGLFTALFKGESLDSESLEGALLNGAALSVALVVAGGSMLPIAEPLSNTALIDNAIIDNFFPLTGIRITLFLFSDNPLEQIRST